MRQVLVPARIDPTPPALGAVVHTLHGRTMGTTWTVKLSAHRHAPLAAWQQGVQAQLDEVVAQMSHWDAHSDLGRFNRAAPGRWQVLPPAFDTVLAFALEVARLSGGAYDPAAGALVDLWGFGPVARPEPFVPPSSDDVAEARSRSGWPRLVHDAASRRVRQPGGLALDLSAVAKGFGVDQVGRWLHRQGLDSFLVEVGGELLGAGMKPDAQPWWVTLETPDIDRADEDTLIALHGLAVATSGDYRRFVAHGGRRYSHTLDPRDGWPIRHGAASVSVVHESAMAADAWSTALTVLGADDGLALADTQALAARFVVRLADGGFAVRTSRAWQALLQ